VSGTRKVEDTSYGPDWKLLKGAIVFWAVICVAGLGALAWWLL
jgi:hypothetical protein